MASALKTVRDTIASDWEGLTPGTDATILYVHVKHRFDVGGNHQNDRSFWFPAVESARMPQSFGNASSGWHWVMPAQIRLARFGPDGDTSFDRVADEGLALVNAVNHRSTWPSADIDFVECTEFTVEQDDLEAIITFRIEVQTEEAG